VDAAVAPTFAFRAPGAMVAIRTCQPCTPARVGVRFNRWVTQRSSQLHGWSHVKRACTATLPAIALDESWGSRSALQSCPTMGSETARRHGRGAPHRNTQLPPTNSGSGDVPAVPCLSLRQHRGPGPNALNADVHSRFQPPSISQLPTELDQRADDIKDPTAQSTVNSLGTRAAGRCARR
jgi:hypothetical protein